MKLIYNLLDGSVVIELPQEAENDKSQAILDAYRMKRMECKVRRSGHVLCGAYP